LKKIAIPIILFIVILIISIWFLNKTKKPEEVATPMPTPSVVLPTVSDDIKVELTAKNNNKIVVLRISGLPDDMNSIEYELTYLTAARLPRGVLGKITLSGEKEIERDDIVLGTCSSGKCVYDTGVESIDLSLKFNSRQGVSVYSKTFPL